MGSTKALALVLAAASVGAGAWWMQRPTGEKAVQAKISISRETFKSSDFSSPVWRVRMEITNGAASQVQLGESLIVYEVGADGRFFGSHIFREAQNETPHENNFETRYGSVFGCRVNRDGNGGLWPLAALADLAGGGRSAGVSLLLAMLGQKPLERMDGHGFGKVNARATQKITEDILMPVGMKDRQSLTVVVVSPVVRGPGIPAHRFIAEFKPGDAKDGAVHEATAIYKQSMAGTAPQQLASQADEPDWKRALGLNAIAEEKAAETNKIAQAIAFDEKASERLRAVAILNLGLVKAQETAEPLTALLPSGPLPVRIAAIGALVSMGANSSAGEFRKLMRDENESLASTAILAAGELKDTEAVGELSVIAQDPKANQYEPGRRVRAALKSLAMIGSDPAIATITGMIENAKLAEPMRVAAAQELGSSKAGAAFGVLSKAALNERTPAQLRSTALRAVGDIGGAPAIDLLRQVAQSKDGPTRHAAVNSLQFSKDPGAAKALIEMLNSPAHPARAQAANALTENKDVVPTMRQILLEKQEPAELRQAAARTLSRQKDKDGKEALLAGIRDTDQSVGVAALGAFVELFPNEVAPILVESLASPHRSVRSDAMIHITRLKLDSLQEPVWKAFQAEKDQYVASSLANYLVEQKFAERSAISFLIDGLDRKRNKAWFSNVRLLKSITGQDLGPANEYGNEKEIEAAISKWREWWGMQAK